MYGTAAGEDFLGLFIHTQNNLGMSISMSFCRTWFFVKQAKISACSMMAYAPYIYYQEKKAISSSFFHALIIFYSSPKSL